MKNIPLRSSHRAAGISPSSLHCSSQWPLTSDRHPTAAKCTETSPAISCSSPWFVSYALLRLQHLRHGNCTSLKCTGCAGPRLERSRSAPFVASFRVTLLAPGPAGRYRQLFCARSHPSPTGTQGTLRHQLTRRRTPAPLPRSEWLLPPPTKPPAPALAVRGGPTAAGGPGTGSGARAAAKSGATIPAALG